MKEIWKDIKDFEGLYEISNLGRVKSLGMYVFGKYVQRELILKPYSNGKGYLEVSLRKNNKRYVNYVHRLVAKHFIFNNDDNKKHVNHKDFNISNNNADNLEWCSIKENVRYSVNNDRYDSSDLAKELRKFGKESNLVKEVIELNNNGMTIEDICRKYKVSYNTFSKYNIKLKAIGTKGMSNNNKKVICLDTNEIFNSIKSANARYKITTIGDCCTNRQKTAGGLHWSYYSE